MDTPAFLPHLEGPRLDEYTATAGRIALRVAAATATAPCPACQHPSRRIHSRYVRMVADVAWGGVPVTLRVQVRRFCCGNTACPRRIFAERLPRLVDRYARQTCIRRTMLQRIGLALGEAAGARLAAVLGLPVGRTALLARVRAAPRPTGEPPRVVSIDEWAWRRGHRFGTILVDLERHRVVDLLADRAADSTAAWLRQRPGIAVVVRDRSGRYADAAHRGAPEATQIADRWHLIHNLAEGLEAFLLQQRAALRAASTVPGEAPLVASDTTPGPLTPQRPRHGQRRAEEASRQRNARLVEQYEAIRRLHTAGADVADSARRVGTSRRTVYRYRDLPEPPAPKRPHRPSRQRVLTPYAPYLLQRWGEGCHNGMRLYRELRVQGYAYGTPRHIIGDAGVYLSWQHNRQVRGAISVRQALSRPPDAPFSCHADYTPVSHIMRRGVSSPWHMRCLSSPSTASPAANRIAHAGPTPAIGSNQPPPRIASCGGSASEVTTAPSPPRPTKARRWKPQPLLRGVGIFREDTKTNQPQPAPC